MTVIEAMETILHMRDTVDYTPYAAALNVAYDTMLAYIRYATYGDCNDCRKKGACRWEVGFGDQVRTNCPHYQGQGRWEPPRVKPSAVMKIREDDTPTAGSWIAVTDRLPEVGVTCLVAFADEGMTFSSLDKSGKWYVVNGLPQPDYWMPLPERPEVSKNG